MPCRDCHRWTLRRQRQYDDGTVQVYYEAPAGKGHCAALNIDTPPEFNCSEFTQEPGYDVRVVTETIVGAPWEHWIMVPCPDCDGAGSTYGRACRRCSGTASVRRYDDGYVADETWDHPRFKELKKMKPVQAPTIDGTVLAPIKANDGALL
jgi:hypothetical protein